MGACAFVSDENGCIRLMPHYAFGVTEGTGERCMRRRIERRVGLRQATQRAGTGMGDRRATLVIRSALLTDAVADDAGTNRIGNGLAGRPAGGNRRQHLHHQSEQDNR